MITTNKSHRVATNSQQQNLNAAEPRHPGATGLDLATTANPLLSASGSLGGWKALLPVRGGLAMLAAVPETVGIEKSGAEASADTQRLESSLFDRINGGHVYSGVDSESLNSVRASVAQTMSAFAEAGESTFIYEWRPPGEWYGVYPETGVVHTESVEEAEDNAPKGALMPADRAAEGRQFGPNAAYVEEQLRGSGPRGDWNDPAYVFECIKGFRPPGQSSGQAKAVFILDGMIAHFIGGQDPAKTLLLQTQLKNLQESMRTTECDKHVVFVGSPDGMPSRMTNLVDWIETPPTNEEQLGLAAFQVIADWVIAETFATEGAHERAPADVSSDEVEALKLVLGNFEVDESVLRSALARGLAPEPLASILPEGDNAFRGIVEGLHGTSVERARSIVGTAMSQARTSASPSRLDLAELTTAQASRTQSALEQYTADLTAMARDGELDPVIGRDTEIEQIARILAKKKKNNPVIIGEAGVGKTAIVEGLAQRIVSGDVPEALADKRVLSLSLSSLTAGARFRGDLESRLEAVLADKKPDDIIFIDELHTMVGAGGSEGGMDVSNILKPALARGLTCIGATTLDEYRKYVEKDAALTRRFVKVMAGEPTVDETVAILEGNRESYEAYHACTILPEALRAAAELATRYIPDAPLPDKPLDLIDQAAGAAAGNPVTAELVAEQVELETGIPIKQLTADEKEKWLNVEEALQSRVIGQGAAAKAISDALIRSRSDLQDPTRPMGSFLFLGPTGVGKTELTKALAAFLFDDEKSMSRFDMSEYMEKHDVSRLIGAPPGYVGYSEGGRLTESVRRKPYQVILFDEVEKAHPDVFNLLLQVLDDGRLTDGQGRTVDFTNTIIIMTSNLGSQACVPGADKETTKALMEAAMKTHFRPELLNRLDDKIVFDRIQPEIMAAIVDLRIRELEALLEKKGHSLSVKSGARRLLADRGYDAEYGARPLNRLISSELKTPIGRAMIGGKDSPQRFVIDATDDRKFSIEAS